VISNSARESFDHLLVQGIKNGLVNQDRDSCEVTVQDNLTNSVEQYLAALTISSYLFRLMVFIHFAADDPTREYIATSSSTNLSDMNEKLFMDAICERANMCCGSLSRDLSQFFPHIGMSTPNIIDRHCASHLHLLNLGHKRHFRVDVNDTAQFHVTLCVSTYDKLDFVVDKSAADAGSGELEMF
jgi:hypothetical protein